MIAAGETMAALKLYDLEPSGNCYKIRLYCALLGLPLEVVPIDFMGGAHKKSPLIGLNPFGEIPILEDGDVCLRDSQAILVYLARMAVKAGCQPIPSQWRG
jgi:glutathione S-transferase